ncbi:MAG: 50S ribosomal protein L10 [Saprospiraceae bacterium]|nr:50S ribosomal protein L10 [Saprospiraceae bacterium]
MTKQDKTTAIQELKERFANAQFFYVTDSSTLTVEQVNNLRRKCFEQGIEMKVVKNTLAVKALKSLENEGYEPLYNAFEGPSSLMFTDNPSAPARLIKEFRETADRPLVKAAYIDSAIFSGDDQLDVLVALKSKDELVGDIIMLLQSPAKNVIGALKSGGQKIAGIVKALEERAGS